MITSRHFSESELKKCFPPSSLQDMKQSTMDRFDKARDYAGIPLVITCAYRTPQWDKDRDRSGTGAHTLGRAMDIRCRSMKNRYKIITALLKAGFTRIGVYETFIHADDSPNHEKEIIWYA